MSITGGVTSGIVDSHGDHRLAMAFSLILRVYMTPLMLNVTLTAVKGLPEPSNRLTRYWVSFL